MELTRGVALQVLADASAATTEPTFAISYVDIFSQSGRQRPGSNQGPLTGTTAAEMAGAPDADFVTREIKSISVYNGDTSARTITVRRYYNSTAYNCIAVEIAVGKSLFYDGSKFTVSYEEGANSSLATSVATNTTIASSSASQAEASVAVASSTASQNTASVAVASSSASKAEASVAVASSTASQNTASVAVASSSASIGVASVAVASSAASLANTKATSCSQWDLAASTFTSVVVAGSIALSGASVAKASYATEGNMWSIMMSAIKSGV